MKYSTFAIAAAAGTAAAQQSAFGQCGGEGWTGATTCVSGYTCKVQNDWYSQCVVGTASTTAAAAVASTKASTSAAKVATTSKAVTSAKVASTSTLVTKVITSAKSSSKVATSVASSKAATTVASSKVPVTTSKASTTAVAATTTRASTSAKASSTAASSTGKVKYAGVNISGFDFGCGTDGTCSSGSYVDPGTAGQDQMNHFVTDDGLNAFRLPVGWQYLVGSTLGATLDTTFFTKYDAQVQYCLSSGAELCIIDLHNYARWNGALIGASGGPTVAQFSSVWSQLATKYKSSPKVAFGIMNEPHDLTSVTDWATTVQTVVTAIRNAGATDNIILLPGNDWTHASTLISDGSAAALAAITNLDGSTTNLVFDVHQYSDSDGSGTSTTCTTDNVSTFTTLATWLRTNGRQAFLSEMGGSSDSTCLTDVCAQLTYLMENSDVYLGWTGWGAGEFATSYALAETPSGSAGSYTDQTIVSQCVAGIFKSA